MASKFKSMTVKIIVEIIIIFLATVILVSGLAFYQAIKPPRWSVSKNPADYGMKYEKINFPSTDGINLVGWFIPALEISDKTIIMMHGYPASKSDIIDLGVFLHNQYNLFFFDFRYMGESEGKFTTAGALEIKDLMGAINYLKENKPDFSQKIGVWGFSLGGAVGLMGAAENSEIKAVVADCSYANLDLMVDGLYRRFGFLKAPFAWTTKLWTRLILKIDTSKVSPEQSVSKIKTPILLIHGDKDIEINLKNSQMIYEEAGGEKELWVVKGAGHGEAYFLEGVEYQKKVLDFFVRYL